MKKIRQLHVILGDQLNHNMSSLQNLDKRRDAVLMMEVADESTYVHHHPQKIILILAAMRHFAAELKKKNIKVHYIKLDSPKSKKSFTQTLANFCSKKTLESIIVTEPGEYRVFAMIKRWSGLLKIPVEIRPDDRFFCSIEEFKTWAKGKKLLRMENFYHMMRQKTGLLMQTNGKPMGGAWNFDKLNRKPFKEQESLPIHPNFKPDELTKDVIKLVKQRFKKHFGDCEKFNYAVTRRHALRALKFFIEHGLNHFGDYQDAMVFNEYYLFHSLLSPYLNIGLLEPAEVCEAAQQAYLKRKAPINAVEGFVRQILGWREYVRGVYWLQMPKYAALNYLNAKRDLPDFYWSGKTKMRCMQHVINQTKTIAHSHHIQRLMVTGNFALLLGVEPSQICEWYLAVYVDAFEWVELPNTLGMAMYADGGILGSKPYAASGSYINRMSNFCRGCHYNIKQKTGDNACPFNYLYWNFLLENKNKLQHNPRMRLTYNNLANKTATVMREIKSNANNFIKSLYE